MAERIDTHQHFWKYDPVEYGWIDDSMAILRRDFLPGDLEPAAARAGIGATVAVQARQSVRETEWLLELAADNTFIRGVVGWVPLTDPAVRGDLERLTASPRLRGVRHVLQGEADDYFSRADFNAGVRVLTDLELTYDLLVFARQLTPAIALVDRHPEQVFVVDHLAKPRIKDGRTEPWRAGIQALAARPNVFCKLSGAMTDADHVYDWSEAGLRPYLETVLHAFGPRRLMFGSDWPVCLVGGDYRRWHEIVANFTADLSNSERDAIFGETALCAYGLKPARPR
jgi:L-fuconolactonase